MSIVWVLIALAAGMLPSPYLLARAMGRSDVIAQMRRKDSPGDAHFLVTRQIGASAGVVAVVADMAKGFIPALVAVNADAPRSTLAAMGLAGVAGHSFAPFVRAAGGRGLTTAAGVSLALIPRAMIGTGLISAVGSLARVGGPATGIGFALLPLLAWIFGYDGWLIGMASGVTGLIIIRRLEGIEEDRAAGVSLPRAFLSRALFDLPRGKRSL